MASDSRMMMILMTTISSISVNPRWKRLFMARTLPRLVLRPVQSGAVRLGVNVEDALSAPGIRVRVVLHGAQAPFRLAGHRIHRNSPQKTQLLAVGIHALDQCLQIGRITLAVKLSLESAAIGRVLVPVDGVAHLPQIVAQVPLLAALNDD